MSEFVEFVQNLNRDRYSRLFWRLISDKTPCGLMLMGQPRDRILNFIEQTKNLGFNLTSYITVDPNDLEDPPANLKTFLIRDVGKSKIKYLLSVDDLSNNFAPILKNAGVQKLNIMFGNQNTDDKFNFYMDHLAELEETYNLLEDEESRETFRGFVSVRVSSRFTDLRFDEMPQYLTPNFLPNPGAITVCAGACDGSTAAMFSDLGCRVIAFEMDRENFEISKKLATEKNFQLENFGLGSFAHEIDYVHYADHIGGSHIGIDLRGGGNPARLKLFRLTSM